MARLLHGCLFILHTRQWYWTWKAFLSMKIYFCQYQNITSIIIKGESETCPISEIATIILSLKYIGSFEAAAFSFTNLFFQPSRFISLYFPFVSFFIFFQQLQERNEQRKNFSPLWAQYETLGLIENFTRRRTEVNFPSADWLSYLRTQLTVFVGGVCLRI